MITGASSGIGSAIARRFAAEGARVIVHYGQAAARAETVATAIRSAGGEAFLVAGDIAQPATVERLVKEAESMLGGIDVWANIAGADILTGANAAQSDLEKLERLIAVDLRGTMLCSWAVVPLMQRAGGGVILNMSWDLALVGMAERNPEMFAATKAGVTGFTRSLARSLAPLIRVNEVAPGWIETAFARESMPADYRAWVVDQTPLRRFGKPEDVAAAAVFLCSDEAAFVTGQTLKVNGGLSS